jgi:hypothetical protein
LGPRLRGVNMSTHPEVNLLSIIGTEYTECIGEDRKTVKLQLRGNEILATTCKFGHTRKMVDGVLMCITTDDKGRTNRCAVPVIGEPSTRTNHH